MIVLPDDDEVPVGAQVNVLIGDALRQSVAEAEPSAAFQARLAAALDAAEQDGLPGLAAGKGEQAGEAGEVARGAGQGSEAAEAAS